MNSREHHAEESDALVEPVPSRRLPRTRRWGEPAQGRKPGTLGRRLWLGGGAAAARGGARPTAD